MKVRTLPLLLVLAIAVTPVVAFGDDGAAIYKSKCTMCHGADGMGNTPVGKTMKAPDLTSAAVQKQTFEDLQKIVTDGKGKMPAYKGKLKESEIDAVVKFIQTFKK